MLSIEKILFLDAEADRYYYPLIANILAYISSDRYLLNFVLSAYLPLGSLSVDVLLNLYALYRQINPIYLQHVTISGGLNMKIQRYNMKCQK